jgi:protein phosphatase
MNEAAGVNALHTAGGAHPGRKRDRNEDRWLAASLDDGSAMLAVADGMGGHPGGDVAAQMIVDRLAGFRPDPGGGEPEEQLEAQLLEAGRDILDKGAREPELESMGSTATAACVLPGRVHWAHVGDSRLYLFRGGSLEQITTDHNFLRELVEAGDMTAREAENHPLGNLLEQCVGCEECDPDRGAFDLRPGDVLLLCSDGLHRELSEQDVADKLGGAGDLQEAAQGLVQAALDRGGRDNVAVVLARAGAGDS